jgi:hypothetical protein
MSQAYFATIKCARFENIEVIKQIFDFLANVRELFALVLNRARYLQL